MTSAACACCNANQDFLEQLDDLDEDKIVGSGHPGYLAFKKTSIKKLRTLKHLFDTKRAAKGLFLVGDQVSVAIACPGGDTEPRTIDWNQYYAEASPKRSQVRFQIIRNART